LKILPIINPYPIQQIYTDDQKVKDEYALKCGFRKKMPEIKKAISSLDFAFQMADAHGSFALSSALRMKLADTPDFLDYKLEMKSQDSHDIYTYRHTPKESNENSICVEIINLGTKIPFGQVVFHGGSFIGDAYPVVGGKYSLRKILSTTLDPQVASVHASYHPENQCLWVITIARTHGIPCYVLNIEDPELGDEYEIILADLTTATCTSLTKRKEQTVIELQFT